MFTTKKFIVVFLLCAINPCAPAFGEVQQGAESCGRVLQPGPVSEASPGGLLLVSRNTQAEFPGISSNIIKNLPSTVQPVVVRRSDPYIDWEHAKRKPQLVLPNSQILNATIRQRRKYIQIDAGIMSPWLRDYLPILVIRPDGSPQFVSFQYASSNDYWNLKMGFLVGDESQNSLGVFPNPRPVDRQLSVLFEIPLVKSDMIVHGGNLIADEEGNIFLTKRVLEDNYPMTQQQIEDEFRRVLFAKSIVWMPRLGGERTGHLDMYAMYIGKRRFVLQTGMYDYEINEATKILKDLGYHVFYVHSPGEGISYVNSLLVDSTILMPKYELETFSDFIYRRIPLNDADRAAKEVFEGLGFKVKTVLADQLRGKFGSLHCLTNKIPFQLNSLCKLNLVDQP